MGGWEGTYRSSRRYGAALKEALRATSIEGLAETGVAWRRRRAWRAPPSLHGRVENLMLSV